MKATIAIGCWIAFYHDWHKITRAVFDNEVDARRWAMDNFCDVEFVTWGQDFS